MLRWGVGLSLVVAGCPGAPHDTEAPDPCAGVFLCGDAIETIVERERVLPEPVMFEWSLSSLTAGDLAGTGTPQVLVGTKQTATALTGDDFRTATDLWFQPGDSRAVYPRIGDLTGDGQADLVLGLPGSDDGLGQVVIFPGPVSAPVSWETPNIQVKSDGTGNAGERPRIADLNGDGVLDLATLDDTTAWVRFGPVLEDLPLGQPEDAWTTGERGLGVSVEAPGDLTGDGVPDLAVVEAYDPSDPCLDIVYEIRVAEGPLGPGELELGDPVLVYESLFFGDALFAPAMDDWDGDGIADVAFVAYHRGPSGLLWLQTHVYMGPLDGSEPDARFASFGVPVGLADFDGDGALDLFQALALGVVAGPLEDQPLHYGQECTLAFSELWTTELSNGHPAWLGELDGDGRPDAVVGGYAGGGDGYGVQVVLSSAE